MPDQDSVAAERSKIAIICETCGSDNVSRDAWANWDTTVQEWVLGPVFDAGFCHRCEAQRPLSEVQI